MANLDLIASTPLVALASATAKTALQVVAPTNQRLRIKSWGVFFDGINATGQPVQVRLLKQSSAGTMTPLTPVKLDNASETVQSTAQYLATAEPILGSVVDIITVHPQTAYEFVFTPGDELIVFGGERLGVECIAPAAVNVRVKIRYEE